MAVTQPAQPSGKRPRRGGDRDKKNPSSDQVSGPTRAADRALEELAVRLLGLVEPVTDVEWWHQAACAQTDPDAFYPEPGDNATRAKRVCAHCDVRNQCLDHALAHDERFGIWGGLSEPERRRLTEPPSRRTG